jgi:hypothetical protein
MHLVNIYNINNNLGIGIMLAVQGLSVTLAEGKHHGQQQI